MNRGESVLMKCSNASHGCPLGVCCRKPAPCGTLHANVTDL